jgi:hypothetical protein
MRVAGRCATRFHHQAPIHFQFVAGLSGKAPLVGNIDVFEIFMWLA